MSKKLILFLMVLLFGSTSFLRADELTVCDGTETNAYVPVYGFYGDAYLKCHYVMPADQLTAMNGGVINSMTFEMASPAEEPWTGTFQVFMTEVDYTEISAFVDETSAVTVYTGTLDATGATMTVTFDTPYNYEGGNLLIGFNLIQKGNYKSASFNGVTATGASVQGYSYSTLSAITPTQRNFLPKTTFVFEPGTVPPVPPTEGLTITPDEFMLGDQALNSNVWKEPFAVKIYNGGEPTVITASMSNTSGQDAFVMSTDIDNMPLETGEALDFTISIQNGTASGEYTEEFTLFYTENRSIMTVPVTANIYNASYPDVVEYARYVNWTSGDYTDTPSADNMHADYNLWGMDEKLPDVVYQFTLAKDSHFHAEAGEDFIAIYKKVSDLHLTAEVEPLILGENGVIEDEIMFAGTYYLVAASDAITTVSANYTEIPAPGEIAFIAPTPADGATSINAPVTIKWAPEETTATEYQVVFGTSPIVNPDDNAWIPMDENYGTYVVTQLLPTTQYFYKVYARNSNGQVSTERRGFTSTLIAPHAVTASETEIFVDQTTLIKWKLAGQGGFTGEVTVADGTSTSSYVPVYGLWVDDFTRSEMIYPAEMLEEMEGGEITSLTFYLSSPATAAWAPAQFNVYMREVAGTTMSSYFGSADATIVYSGALDGTGTTMTITLDTPYTYDGGNLLIGIEEPVEGTYKSASFYGIDATGASASGYSSSSLAAVTFNQRDFLPKVTFTCGGRATRNLLGYNVYYGQKNGEDVYEYTKANSALLTEREYLLGNLPYDVTADGLDINVTAVYDQGESGHSTPVVKVWVSGYGTFTGQVTELISGDPVAGVTVTFNGKDEFNNTVSFEGTTNANGVYTINNVKAGQYIGEATLDGMEPNYSEQVVLAYNGIETVDFVIHEEYKPVLSVYAEEVDSTMSRVKWSLTETISGGGSGGSGSATTFEEGFEGGMPEGWTVVDANNDGYTWTMTSAIPSTWTYYSSLTLDWYRTGTNAICSGSYINGAGALNPDEYLVTPQVNIANGSTFSFYAAATDASYPADHFGVFVSDDASNWTSVQEWTLTAKSGANGGRASRDGEGAKLGSWYQYSVDLSAYAGQKYIAIRHFNCYDQYIMCVDDIALSAAKGGTRSVQEYAVYRKAILKQAALTPADSVYFGTTTDTNYADFGWANMEPGLYQYGVSAHYPIPGGKGTRSDELTVCDGTTTNSYVPVYGFYADAYLKSEMVYPASLLSDMANGTISSMKFYSSTASVAWGAANFQVFMTEVADETISAFVGTAGATVVYEGALSIDGGEMLVEFDTPYTYNGGNLLVGVYNTATGTYVSSTWLGETATGASVQGYSYSDLASISPTQRNFLPKATFTYAAGGAGGNDDPITPITWSNVLPKDMEAVVTVNAHITVGSVAGAVVTLVNDFENMTPYVAELDETGTVTFEDFRKGEYTVTVDLDGYMSDIVEMPMSIWADSTVIDAHFTEIFKPVDAFAVSGTGFASWTDILPEPNRFAERYHVLLNGVFQGETTDNFMQLDVTGLTVGQTYTASVAVIYTTGMSAFVTAEFTLIDCATVEQQVEDLEATPACMDVILTWNGATPGPGPGPTPPPTPGDDSFTEGFEGGLNGWNVLTVLSDGGEWIHSSQNLGGYDYSELAHTGTGFAMCYSFVDYVGSFNTDSYMYTPQMYTIQAGSTLTFFADNANDQYPENFSVCVSTAANPSSASDFTTVWSGGAKGNGSDGAMVRRADNNRYENWRQHTVSLAAYAGQNVWIAFHDSNYDMYEIWIDDVVLSPNTKGGSTAETCGYTTAAAPVDAAWDLLGDFDCTSGYQYGVASDGQYIYTSSWSASSTSMFYKYDMDGNFIEEFNVSGCGQIRDLTYDGEYFYGVANSSVIYCIDLANHTLVGQTSTAYGAMRCCSYDSQRDGFWVVGNWSGNLSLVDRTGAVTFTGPAPESASGVAYYKDADNVEHVLCFNNADNGVYDYNVTTNVMGGQVFNYNNAPGAAGGSAGGCHVGTYAGKLAFFGDMQQSPNYVAIYELAGNPGPGPGPTPSSTITPNKFNIFMDGEFVGATAESTFTVTCEDTYLHNYEVYFVDSNYNFSCGGFVQVAAGTGAPVTDLTAVEGYDPTYGEGAQITWNGAANQYKIYANGQLLGATAETEVFIYGLQAGTYTFGVVAVYDECESEMVTVDFVYDAIAENEIVNAIYPNPTSSDLHINATAMKHISVYNAMGQMVYDQDVTGDEVILNMGQYEAGVYMVNVITENGSSVKRITVTK